jgi:hypothetical protein
MSRMQAFAKMVLGKTPVDWQQFGNFDMGGRAGDALRRALAHIWEKDLVYTWCHENGYMQFWIDALTIDPTKLLEDEQGIILPKMKPMLVQTDLANASLGSVPVMQVWLDTNNVGTPLAACSICPVISRVQLLVLVL